MGEYTWKETPSRNLLLTADGKIRNIKLLFAGFDNAITEDASIGIFLVVFVDLLLLLDVIEIFVIKPVAFGTIESNGHLVEFFRVEPDMHVGILAREPGAG